MRIQILDRAERDMIEGFHFYESQGIGLGSYFLTNLYTANLTRVIIVSCPADSRSQSSTRLARTLLSSMRFWIAAAIQRGFENALVQFENQTEKLKVSVSIFAAFHAHALRI